MKIYDSILSLVGKTPLVKISKYSKEKDFSSDVLLKLENYNPAGSAKDRIALAMLEEAERQGILQEGSVIIESTSGNTGIGLAAVAAAKGYRIIITMPESMSIERRKMLTAYGAELVLTDAALGVKGAADKARELASQIENSFIPDQFANQMNPKAHYETTGPEIWNDTDGKIDIFVCGVGTGGTISGVGKFLKEKNPDIRVIAVEPEDSPLLSKGVSGPHGIQGIGANFVPATLDTKIYDEIICVATPNAYNCARELAKTEGILVGISSGAVLSAIETIATREENKGKTIVAFMTDGGEKYISTDLFK